MSKQYLCPSCRAILNVEENIVMAIERKNGKAGLIMLHPEVGNYAYIKHPHFDFDEDEKLDFYCPVCHIRLQSELNENLAKVILKEKNEEESTILFSQIAGEKSTYRIKGESVETYGRHKEKYIDFLGLSQIK